MTRVAFLPGDGIGREVLPGAREVLAAAGFEPEWVELPVGWDEWRRAGDALPASTIEAMRSTQAAFFGAITSKGPAEAERELAPGLRGAGHRYQSPILRLRRLFQLNLNVRPVRTFQGNPNNVRGDFELVVFRENSEGLYAEIEAHPTPPDLLEAWKRAGVDTGNLPAPGPDTALSLRVITRARTRALCEAAFVHARRHGRKRVTLVEKANVLRKTGGLVQEVFRDVAKAHPGVVGEELQVDAACALLVRDPRRFDVIAATNLFGDIVSDLAAEVGGGLGLAPSANLGPGYALFEPVHGSAPDIAGKGIANPVGAVLAGAMLARHLGDAASAGRVENAVVQWFRDGGPFTPDLGGREGTREAVRVLSELARAR